ncbi:nuclear transport factor 2 family protein [Paraburkholderia phymatum]|uniref:Nuclear transport factor 2 family protein n=1 Tax=Paraburkholderia phymatum TaxID=148447 RepID=A0ACC6U2G9_9BURK
MSQNEAFSAARLVDRMIIQHVMAQWCHAVDRLDRQGMLAVFHDGATDSHGPYIGPVEGLVDWVIERHKAIPFSSHFIGNMLIDFASEDVAIVETYVRTIQQYPPEAKAQIAQFTGGASGAEGSYVDVFTSSRYLDRFERRDGEWKISERTLIQDWKRLDEVKVMALQPKEGWILGKRDGNDESQVVRRRFCLDAAV